MFTSFVNIISPLGVYPKEIIPRKGNTIEHKETHCPFISEVNNGKIMN